MSGYVNANVDILLDSDDIMQGIMDDVTDVVKQTMFEEASDIIATCYDEIKDIVREVISNELDIDDEISSAVSAELENYDVMFVRK